ncbi:MAG: hypothetical protein OXI73_12700, partial [Rhodospirillales bacterium]|nr:hypothetical protein [Rhodospirillales bacterium]
SSGRMEISLWRADTFTVSIERDARPTIRERVPRRLPVDTGNETAGARQTRGEAFHTRPQWLADAHAELNAAVATAYGWDAGIS